MYETPEQRLVRLRSQRRKYRRQNLVANILAGAVVVGGIAGLLVLFALLGSVPVYLGWNLGVVGISHALHGHVQHISFWVALGASLFVGVLSRVFRGASSVNVKTK